MQQRQMFAFTFVGTPILFWMPDLVIHASRGRQFGAPDVILLSVLLPAFTCTVVLRLLSPYPRRMRQLYSLVGVLGIWMTGPVFMMISSTFSGGGFAQPDSVSAIVVLLLLFPITCFSMAAHNGTLPALLLTTIGMPAFAVYWRSMKS